MAYKASDCAGVEGKGDANGFREFIVRFEALNLKNAQRNICLVKKILEFIHIGVFNILKTGS